MKNKSLSVTMIMEDDIRELVEEWEKVPRWLKKHLATRFPAQRYEGELTFSDDCLVFRGYDIKERTDCGMEIPLHAIEDIYLGFSDYLKSGIDLTFGMGGPTPVALCYRDGDREKTAYFHSESNNYAPHISINNRLMYEELDCMVSRRKGIYGRNIFQQIAV